jgi:hypothetical protein
VFVETGTKVFVEGGTKVFVDKSRFPHIPVYNPPFYEKGTFYSVFRKSVRTWL